MSVEPVQIIGGKSVFCINENQLAEARRLAEQDPVSSGKIQEFITELEETLSRNERAALAFMLIERLKHNSQ